MRERIGAVERIVSQRLLDQGVEVEAYPEHEGGPPDGIKLTHTLTGKSIACALFGGQYLNKVMAMRIMDMYIKHKNLEINK